MEKIILVFYVAVGNMSSADVEKYMQKIAEKIKLQAEKEQVIFYVIPIKGEETRVECLNPKLVSEEEYQKAKELLDKNQKIVDEIVKAYNNSKEKE